MKSLAAHAIDDQRLPQSKREVVGALVVGGDYQGLGIVRSLGRHGIPICVVDDEHSIARFSKYTTYAVGGVELRDEIRTVDALLEIGNRLGLKGWILYPTRDETVAALSRYRDRLAEFFRVPTPEWNTIQWAWNKWNTYRLAESLNIPTPKMWSAASISELRCLDITFPIAIKPAIKEHFFYATKAKAWRADSWEQLEELFARATKQVGSEEVIVQELIPGDGRQQFAYCGFFKQKTCSADVIVRRTRQHPREFGRASTFVETSDVPALKEYSERFLSAINYYGLVEIEYKLDSRDGQYKLLDVNARTWGYHSLGYGAGVDFPYLLFADQLGISVEHRPVRQDVSWVRLTTDIPTGILEILAGNLSWKDYLRSLRRANVEAVFSREDPLPGIVELALIPYLLVHRGY
jgi:D-aspartate ligase